VGSARSSSGVVWVTGLNLDDARMLVWALALLFDGSATKWLEPHESDWLSVDEARRRLELLMGGRAF
jgi:hypothetical protein